MDKFPSYMTRNDGIILFFNRVYFHLGQVTYLVQFSLLRQTYLLVSANHRKYGEIQYVNC